MKRLLLLAGLVPAFLLLLATGASAHPLGNFTVNQYSGVVIARSELRVQYVVDMAEIPTFQTRPQIDRNGNGQLSPAELARYAAGTCPALASRLRPAADGRRLTLAVGRTGASLRPGQAGLPTLRLTCALTAPLRLDRHTAIGYSDGNFAGRVGWREVTAAGDGTTLVRSDVPTTSASAELTAYPRQTAPLDVRGAHLTVRPGGPRLAGGTVRAVDTVLPRGVDGATTAFLGFVGRSHLNLGVGLLSVLLAIALGGLHALAPGHGKTVMAAYLVGRRGSRRTALTIGTTVTLTHTGGVLVLGIALSASTALAPERLFPIMGLVSGMLLAAIGAGLLRGALRRTPHSHSHPHGHGHSHGGGHGHSHDHGAHGHDHAATPVEQGAPRRRSLIAMGFAGGLVPSPSALVVLLGAIAFHRAWFGVILVTAYGVGMAATLTLAGLLLVRARTLLDRRAGLSGRIPGLVTRALPIGTAGVITVVGLGLALRGAAVAIG